MGVMMTELQTSIPGDIPGLLRRGSPVFLLGSKGRSTTPYVVTDPPNNDGLVWIACPGAWRAAQEPRIASVALDLTDPTGRAHAAWWSTARFHMITDYGEWSAARYRLCRAMEGADMTPEQIDTLARLVLRLAGRS